MYSYFFTISFLIVMVTFLLSIWSKNQTERLLSSILSCLLFMILAYVSFDVDYITDAGTIINIHDYSLAVFFILLAMLQLLRIFAISYDDNGV